MEQVTHCEHGVDMSDEQSICPPCFDRVVNQFKDRPKHVNEQRRYEIARDCLAGMLASKRGDIDGWVIVTNAVRAADALLAELERGGEGTE